jgi:hypothetical protein
MTPTTTQYQTLDVLHSLLLPHIPISWMQWLSFSFCVHRKFAHVFLFCCCCCNFNRTLCHIDPTDAFTRLPPVTTEIKCSHRAIIYRLILLNNKNKRTKEQKQQQSNEVCSWLAGKQATWALCRLRSLQKVVECLESSVDVSDLSVAFEVVVHSRGICCGWR